MRKTCANQLNKQFELYAIYCNSHKYANSRSKYFYTV